MKNKYGRGFVDLNRFGKCISRVLSNKYMHDNHNEKLISTLSLKNLEINNGRGANFLKSIIDYLSKNDFESARLIWVNDGDKSYQYDGLYDLLKNIFGERK